jgi:hypothetical protein
MTHSVRPHYEMPVIRLPHDSYSASRDLAGAINTLADVDTRRGIAAGGVLFVCWTFNRFNRPRRKTRWAKSRIRFAATGFNGWDGLQFSLNTGIYLRENRGHECCANM